MTDRKRSNGPERGGKYRLITLGRVSLHSVPERGPPEEILGPGKPLALLVYLASSPGKSATRDHLVDLLWANLELDPARHALRQALWYLRKEIGQKAIRSDRDRIVLATPLDFDREQFLAAIEREDYESAVELYGGEFLPVFAAPGGAEFEKWADIERYRLKTHFLRASETLVQDLLERNQFSEATALAVRARDADPLNQTTWRLLLEAFMAAGEDVRARIEAHALEQKLEEFDRSPEPGVQRLLLAAKEGSDSARKSGSSDRGLDPELIGREHAFATILSAWRSARSGEGQHVHVVGGSGLGKTRLLAEVEGRLNAMGVRTVRLRSHPGERQLAYGMAAEIAASLAELPGGEEISDGTARTLVELNPDLTSRYPVDTDKLTGDSVGDERLRRRTVALRAQLDAVTAREPVALLLDDLHWTDPASRQVLASLVSKVSAGRALIVTTTRPRPETVPFGSEHIHRLELDPLTVGETHRFLTSLAALPIADWAKSLPSAVRRATGGSPLLILETLRLALEHEWLVLNDGEWECPESESLDRHLSKGGALQRRVERLPESGFQLLLLLHVAGRPLETELLATAADNPESTEQRLHEIEVRGLVRRASGGWIVAHDEIAAAARDLATADDLHSAHRSLGRALVGAGGDEPRQLLRAGRHLARTNDRDALERVYARWVASLRERHDRRSAASLAAELLESDPDSEEVRDLVGSLPLSMRFNLPRIQKVGAAAVLLLGATFAGVGILASDEPRPPDASLYMFPRSADGSVSGFRLPISQAGFVEKGEIDLRREGEPVPEVDGVSTRHPILPNPVSDQWAYVRTVADSGAWEVFLIDGEGAHRRMTHAPGDDVSMSWSPDGRYLVLQTSRWDSVGWHDLAIMDVQSGEVRRLTRQHDDHDAIWSLDGTRIAFRRKHISQLPDQEASKEELCLTTVDGSWQQCFVPPLDLFSLLAWEDTRHLLARVRDPNGEPCLARIDLENRSIEVIDRPVRSARVSPDGRWAAVSRAAQGAHSGWYVFPTRNPEQAVPVASAQNPTDQNFSWSSPRSGGRYLERVEIVAPDSLSVGAPYQLVANGFRADGSAMPVPVRRWRSSDPSGAPVDAKTGILHPRRLGPVTLAVSAGGWRHDSVRVVIVPPRKETVFREDWTTGLNTDWVPFGDPRPQVTEWEEGGRAFWAAGDGLFYSGVYSRREFNPSAGLGLEARLSTAKTAPAQQELSVGLRPWTTPEAVESWDHRTGGLPTGSGSCGLRYPEGDGFQNAQRILTKQRPVEPDADIASGTPYTVRIQVFPDGTCGVSVNGEPLARWRIPRASLQEPHRIVLQGKSVDTKMLVGELEVWEGVRTDVDWSDIEGWGVDAAGSNP